MKIGARLAGKVALITGAGQGIGRLTALIFAEEGAKVAVVDKSGDHARTVAKEVNDAGFQAMAMEADITVPKEVKAVVQATMKKFGGIHILINNAGVTLTRSFIETTPEDVDFLININLKGTILMSQAVISHMIEAGGGSIVHNASNAGIVGRPWQPAYGASKAAVISLTKSMSLSLAAQKIRVNCVCPGSIDTPMLRGALSKSGNFQENWRRTELVTPLGRIGDPEDIAYAMLFLASEEAKFITGIALPVDGGGQQESPRPSISASEWNLPKRKNDPGRVRPRSIECDRLPPTAVKGRATRGWANLPPFQTSRIGLGSHSGDGPSTPPGAGQPEQPKLSLKEAQMLLLLSDWGAVERELGYSLPDHFLMAVRSLDNPKAVTPLILKQGLKTWALFPEVERGNVESLHLPPDLHPVFMRRYFTFEPAERGRPVFRDLIEAIQSVSNGAKEITIDRKLPVAIEAQLIQHFRVSLEEGADMDGVSVRKISREWISARLGAGWADAHPVALKLLNHSPVRNEIKPYLEPQPDRRFSSLDELLSQNGLSSVVVSSRLNMQEIGGVPSGQRQRPLAVVYPIGSPSVYVIEPGMGGMGERFRSAPEAIRPLLAGGPIGLEAEDLDAGLYRSFGLSDQPTFPADTILRRWRDGMAVQDLAYYIIATRTSLFATEKALHFAADQVKAGQPVTELDVYARYFNGLHEFIRSTVLPIRVTRAINNIHSGSRTLYPSNPACFLLNRSVNTLKIDAGCWLHDEEGYTLGCSDVARTLTFTPEGKELYQLLMDGVRRALIPEARAGATGEKVFLKGVNAVWDRRTGLSNETLVPRCSSLAEIYDRDIGHLLGKNNLAHLRFIRGDRGRLIEGMIACCEYQWPFKGHSIAYEDTCLVTPNGGLNFTVDGD